MAARARQRVETLARLHPSRNGVFPARLARAAAYVEQEFRSIGYEVHTQRFYVHGDEFCNLVVELPGEQDSSVIVIGAHYDTVIGTPGADDNASGVAGVMELASLLQETSLRHSIIFVAYANEEPPYFHSAHMGSRHHARFLRDSGKHVHLMFALEMLGYADDNLKQAYPFPGLHRWGKYPERGNFIGVVGNLRTRTLARVVRDAMRSASSVGVESLAAPGFLPPLFLSDHASYWKYGSPAVMITDTAFLRNPHYHLSSDTPETLNYTFLANVVAGIAGAVQAIDAL
jgi:Zn-dependent M28 family amino/carboxypeptidase